ncbi:MAG: flagellar protein FlaG, partial [Nitrospinaceae bacterium]|nr:flagellar protein FlaG [Nitrospinaceae bacterium]
MDSQATGQVEKKTVQVDQKLSSETRKVPSGGSSSGQTNDTVSLSQRGQAAVSQEVKDGSVKSKLRKVDVMDNNQVVIKIVDSETQKVVRQIPKEEEVRLKQAMQENL